MKQIAGTTTAYHFGNDAADLKNFAWHDDNAYDIGDKFAHEVRQKKPNPFGLYDMHGNVLEWCADWYDEDYYANSPTADPTGSTTGSRRVLRDGGWLINAGDCRSAGRARSSPDDRGISAGGFRVALVADE